MTGTLLQTKLYKPQLRPSVIPRPRLTSKMIAAQRCKLTLICAPAGFGKTTLVVDFLSQLHSGSQAWFAIDEQDNDPTRFLSYLITAVQSQWPEAAEAASGALHSPQPPPSELILTALINGMTGRTEKLILVLDDYHLIETKANHDILAFILDHQAPSLHLVIITRADPLLPLARLRARGEMIELRKDDLRFTTAEAAHFLNQVMGLNLAQEQVAALEQQTEGWIAGLQLAALSMQGRKDIPGFIASFSGTNRFILDYLADEVLRHRPQGTRDFLLQTAVLERLSGPLCDAVMGQNNSQAILEQLEQANLFLFPLDDSRGWFRYHRLFAELLRHKLRAQGEPILAELHLRAAIWYEEQDFVADAIHHALAGEDWGRAGRLIGQATDSMLKGGQIVTLIDWCEQLPPPLIDAAPNLGLSYAWALLLVGRLDEAQEILGHIEAQAQPIPLLMGQTAAAQAYLARSRGDNAQVIEKSKVALSLLGKDDEVSRSNVTLNLGLVYWHEGRLSEAEEALEEAAKLSRLTANRYGELAAQIFLARTLASSGKLHQAEMAARDLVQTGTQIPILALAHYDLGAIYYEWNDLQKAGEEVNEGIALSRRSGHVEFENAGHMQHAFILLAQGDSAGALRAAQTSHRLSLAFSPVTQARSAAIHVQIALALGELATAVQWAEHLSEDVDAHSLYRFLGLTLPRLLIAQGKKEEAARRLRRCYETAVRCGWGYGLVATCALQSLAASSAPEAQQFLIEALRLAEPEHFVRTFADLGQPMARLLQNSPAQAIMPQYIAEITAAIGSDHDLGVETSPPGNKMLIEPLSERELEILQLLDKRQSNAEIALILNVSVNTVKTHLQHIYEKLGVHNRKTAVTAARELNLI